MPLCRLRFCLQVPRGHIALQHTHACSCNLLLLESACNPTLKGGATTSTSYDHKNYTRCTDETKSHLSLSFKLNKFTNLVECCRSRAVEIGIDFRLVVSLKEAIPIVIEYKVCVVDVGRHSLVVVVVQGLLPVLDFGLEKLGNVERQRQGEHRKQELCHAPPHHPIIIHCLQQQKR